MNDTVLLLLTGFCVTTAIFTDVYYFVEERMSWNKARDYCRSEYISLVPIFNSDNMTTLMDTPTGTYTDKAWIGLYENSTKWFWVDGEVAIYSNWGANLLNNFAASEFCVAITRAGVWKDISCSERRNFVCAADGKEGLKYSIEEKALSWSDAKTYCEDRMSVLASIPDQETNSDIQEQMNVSEAWIGLSRPELWYWSVTGGRYLFRNWQTGQPDNQKGGETCATVVVESGHWTDQQCEEEYPFFCYGSIYLSSKTVVRMKIQSRANMEDPAISANLQEQLRAELAKRGVTDIKLTWKKLPVKQTQESTDNERLLLTV